MVSVPLLTTGKAYAQRHHKKVADTTITFIKKDSSASAGKLLPFDKVITNDARMYGGIFGVCKVKDRYYFQIPDSLLDRDIHVISRIAEGPAKLVKGMLNFAGDDLGDMQISFVKAPDNKLYIKQLIYRDKATDSSANGLYGAIQNNNMQPVMSVFEIKTFNRDAAAVIDVTDYINSDQSIITGNLRNLLQVEGFQPDKSHIEHVYAYPENVDFVTVKTYSTSLQPATLRINTSFVLLPKEPMKWRIADERVGFLTHKYNDFDLDEQRARVVESICRWRLEPAPKDMARYMSGELVEPQKPIVFYIDPATPAKWVPYLIQAVNDWQTAFECAGFKNAIRAEATDEKDTLWSTRDDRFNTIIYAPSISAGIKPNMIIDPRSGEIIHATIHIDHNILGLLHDNYMIQAANVDTGARRMQFSDQLMGRLLRAAVCAHVGTTLGLLQNAGASATVPVELIKDRSWVRQHGFCTSIIHDVLMNYTATPADQFGQEELLPRIGEYDRWAINWGYRLLPQYNNAYEESACLRKLIMDSLTANPRLFFSAVNNEGKTDARANATSLSSDPVKAARYGIMNLKEIVGHLYDWTKSPEEVYTASSNPLNIMVGALTSQYYEYLNNVTGVFGTIYYNPRSAGENKPVYELVPLAKQKAAIHFLNEEVFAHEPNWMLTHDILEKGVALPSYNYVFDVGTRLLSYSLLNFTVLKKMNVLGDKYGSQSTMSLSDYLTALRSCIWPELLSGKKVSDYHMVLQRTYLNSMGAMIDNKRDVTNATTIATIRGHLADLQTRITSTRKLNKDSGTEAHYADLVATLAALLDPKRPAPPAVPNVPGASRSGLVDYSAHSKWDY
jgi:hypothetical protein